MKRDMDTLEHVWQGTIKIIKGLQNLSYERLKETGLLLLQKMILGGLGREKKEIRR